MTHTSLFTFQADGYIYSQRHYEKLGVQGTYGF